MANKLQVQGYEKFWSVLFGAGTAAAVTTLILGVCSYFFPQTIPLPTSETIVAAISALVITVFNAFNVFFTANTTPEGNVAGGGSDEMVAEDQEVVQENAPE